MAGVAGFKYGAALGNVMFKGIQVASISSTAPYIAGALALGALTTGAAYAFNKYTTDQNYVTTANYYENANKLRSQKETSLRDNEYLDEHGDVRDKNTGKMVYY